MLEQGTTFDATSRTATVPSNIALIKYWGKRDGHAQWPANDSLSMTLDAAHTLTTATLAAHRTADELYVDDRLVASGSDHKALNYLTTLRRDLGFSASLTIHSRNSFPADCGIASSASGLAALTTAAIAAWTGAQSFRDLDAAGFDRAALATLARLGSGSACRSLHGGYVLWEAGSSPLDQRVSVAEAAGVFDLADVIVILSRDKKAVPSTVAHKAAWSSPFFAPRLAGLPDRLANVKKALRLQDFTGLGQLIETEALEMHAVMMTASPASTYMLPRTSEFFAWLRTARRRGDFEAYFTLDAGPNPHVLCRPEDAARVADRIRRDFGADDLILDKTGTGPTLHAGTPLRTDMRNET